MDRVWADQGDRENCKNQIEQHIDGTLEDEVPFFTEYLLHPVSGSFLTRVELQKSDW